MPQLLRDPEQPEWMDYANCLGVEPDLFFPSYGASTLAAKAVCAGCVVRSECLEYALENHERGIWGGLGERERARIRRLRRLAPVASFSDAAGSAARRVGPHAGTQPAPCMAGDPPVDAPVSTGGTGAPDPEVPE